LKELNVRSSVLMAYNPKNVWPDGRLEILKGYEGQTGLLEAAEKAGIKNLLLDTATENMLNILLQVKVARAIKPLSPHYPSD